MTTVHTTPMDAVSAYGAAMAAGDLDGVRAVLADDAVWHQPGANPLSGDHVGPDAILAHLARFMQLSHGTFTLETESAVPAGDLVVTTIRFAAQRDGLTPLDQRGADVFRVADGRIAEVWLISEDQATEDAFWTSAA